VHIVDRDRRVRVSRENAEGTAADSRHLTDHQPRGDAEDPEAPRHDTLVGVRRDARIDVLPHGREPALGRTRRTVDEEGALLTEDPQVGDDLALRRERRGILSLPRGERRDIVGHETGERLRGFRARDAQPSAMTAVENDGVTAERVVLGRDPRIREHDAPAADLT
jgi:hypothetical protein